MQVGLMLERSRERDITRRSGGLLNRHILSALAIPLLAFGCQNASKLDKATGASAGKRQMSPVRFVKEWGPASPQIFQALARNEVITSALFEFAIFAYCFMPDHVHLLVFSESENADLRAFVKRFKQMSGFAYRHDHGQSLWQPGYHERVLRGDGGDRSGREVHPRKSDPCGSGACDR